MKNLSLLIVTLIFSSCQIYENSSVSSGSIGTLPSASTICSGTTILGVNGTADCSEGISFLSFASRKDNASFPYLPGDFAAFFAAPDRVVASLKDEAEENLIFTDNHSVIPNPLADSDGRYAPCLYDSTLSCGYLDAAEYPQKRHYLETIAKNGPITTRANIVACGISGTIETRISDCATLNGLWSFYDGKKYGQDGEGDWKLVSVVGAGPKFEVWRDERTKLLWSDSASAAYNWYQAAGYAKNTADSIRETQFISQPGITHDSIPEHNWEREVFGIDGSLPLQPTNPISVCPDVDISGAIAAGGGDYTNYAPNPETDFKAGLYHPRITWRIPSRNDWLLAEVNGIRKVLPNMDVFNFWSSSSDSYYRSNAWIFMGGNGMTTISRRYDTYAVRCVSPSRD